MTLETPNGSEQFSPDIPMRNTETGRHGLTLRFSVGDFVYISAQNNTALGNVVCSIRGSDGTVISQNRASSNYGIATCEGTAR